MGNQTWAFDYHPSWSLNGDWIIFTSERRSPGQSDLYRVRPDGTGLEVLEDTDSVEDAGTLSPDGSKVAYVSTKGNYTTNMDYDGSNKKLMADTIWGDSMPLYMPNEYLK